MELTATWYATPDLTLRGNYTYTHSEQKTGDYEGFPLARTPEHMANLRGDWVTPIDGLEAWASLNYHGSEINAGPRITPAINEGQNALAARRRGPNVAIRYVSAVANSNINPHEPRM